MLSYYIMVATASKKTFSKNHINTSYTGKENFLQIILRFVQHLIPDKRNEDTSYIGLPC